VHSIGPAGTTALGTVVRPGRPLRSWAQAGAGTAGGAR